MKFYDYELSADGYKVRLLLGYLGLKCETIQVDYYPGREHRKDWFLRLSPLGALPVIDDDGFVLTDVNAILTYIAARYDRAGTWYPLGDPGLIGEVAQWLGFAGALGASAGAARLHDAIFLDIDIDAARTEAHRLLRVLDEHLWFAEADGRHWLCPAKEPTIADIACFADVVLSEEGGVSRQDYPAIRRWLDRVKRIAGFSVMSGVFPAGPGVTA
jgi:glutathione S-transferase